MFRIISTYVVILLLAALPVSAAPSAKEVHVIATKAVQVEAESQKKYQQWAERKETIASEIRDMKAMDSWLEYQNKKHTKYIKKQEEVIAELKRRKEEAKRIKIELEPFLETVVNSLGNFTKSDLPFLTAERKNRIQFLHDSLDDYNLELSEKLRRVLEALQVETEYGRNISTTKQQLEINGEPTQVSIFRLGRVAMFYQTMDGSETGVWDDETNSWKPLDNSYSLTLHHAEEMAEKKRAVELLDLPIGVAQ